MKRKELEEKVLELEEKIKVIDFILENGKNGIKVRKLARRPNYFGVFLDIEYKIVFSYVKDGKIIECESVEMVCPLSDRALYVEETDNKYLYNVYYYCKDTQEKVTYAKLFIDIESDKVVNVTNIVEDEDFNNIIFVNPNEDKKVKKSRKKSGIFNGHDWGSTGIKKMDDLYLSLTEINYRKHNDIVGIALRCYIDMLIYEFLRVQKKIGEVNRVDFEQQEKYNDDKYDKLKLYIKSTYAISDEEIDDSTLRSLTKFNNKDNPQKVPELGNMITYIVNHPELLNNDTRLVQALGRFKSAKDFISLQSCNMFVHNQYVTPTASELESMVTTLAPIIDAMYAIVKNEQ